MKLWLLRHGEAEPHARTDAARALTDRGRKAVQRSAAQLVGQALGAILVSPYVRAQQTAELVRDSIGFVGTVDTVPWLTPDGDPREALSFIAEWGGQDLLLVTHNPFVGELASLLLHGHRQQPLPMSTASLAELEGDSPIPGLMFLRTLHSVR